MHIEPVAYMEWAKLHPRARINLSRSGLADRALVGEPGLDGGGLAVNGSNAYGHPALVSALSARYGVQGENIFTTSGASQAIFMICAALLEAGDRVLVERPAYEPLLAVPRLLGAEILRLERRFDEAYDIDLESYRRALALRPKLVILTDLHNPSGVKLRAGTLRELAASAAGVGAMVFVDEIYLEFAGGDPKATSFTLGDNIIVASSLTKAYGLGGLRCGWVFAPARLVAALRRLADHMNVEGVYIAEQISALAMSRLDSWTAKSQPVFAANLSRVREFIRGEKRLSWVEPAAGIVCFPRIQGSLDGAGLAALLEKKYETTVVPGHFFEEPRHFRLGFGGPVDDLARGLDAIRRALDEA